MMSLLRRAFVGLRFGEPEAPKDDNASSEGLADAYGVQYVRDYMSQPAQSVTSITASGTPFASQNPVITFRSLRFDAAGSVTYKDQAGNSQTRTVAAGEVWMTTSNAITAITSYTGAVDGYG